MSLTMEQLKELADVKPQPEEFLYILRQAHPKMVYWFQNGACYSLYLMLALFYPQAVCYYDVEGGHIWTWIDRAFYDIEGEMREKDRARVNLVRLPHPDHNPMMDNWGTGQNFWDAAKDA